MKIAILGGGIEGKSLIRYFSERGADITLHDKRHIDLKEFGDINIKACFESEYMDNLTSYDVVFRSPGIPWFDPNIQLAIENGANISSLTKYFFEHCPAPIIGVTGTKGKGTTSSILYEILKRFHPGRVHLAGNIGNSPLEHLGDISKDDLVILELSSFQLQDLTKSPHIAVMLGISEDHLDYHLDMNEYIDAKKQILYHQTKDDIAVINIDTVDSRLCLNDVNTKHVWQVTNEFPKGITKGAFHEEGTLYIVDKKKRFALMSVLDLPIFGKHNIANVLAASAAAYAIGVPLEIIREGILSFKGLPHRLEFVAEMNDVKYYNDSASTNPETCIAAIRAFHQPLILIAGGSEKNVDYTMLGEEIMQATHLKVIILMGQTSKLIEKAIDRATVKFHGKSTPLEIVTAENYQEAFMSAKIMAQPGDIVLLSPASASFDMFSGYQERGDVFKEFVRSL